MSASPPTASGPPPPSSTPPPVASAPPPPTNSSPPPTTSNAAPPPSNSAPPPTTPIPPPPVSSPPPNSASPPPTSPPPATPPPATSPPPTSAPPPPTSPPPATPPPASPPPLSSSPPPSPSNSVPPPASPPPASPPPPPPSNPAPPPASPPATSPSPPPPSNPAPPPASPPAASPPPPLLPPRSPPPPQVGPPSPVLSPPPPPLTRSPPPPITPPRNVPPPSPPPSSPLTPSPPSPPLTPSPPSPPLTPSPPPGPPPPSSNTSSSSSSTGAIAGGGAAAAVVLALLLGVFLFLCRRSRRRRPPTPTSSPHPDYPYPPHYTPSPVKLSSSETMPLSSGPSRHSGSRHPSGETPLSPSSPAFNLNFAKINFTFEELARATAGFSDANILGRGGFGQVFKGTLDGKEFAVKRLTAGSGQGDREFLAEVEKLSRVHHKHLVTWEGYCISGSQRMLVYEYLPNKTLEFHLHGKDQPTMEWSIRVKIAVGSAKGLAYLHEDCRPKIIHRDIKAANILLDMNFEPKVSDFGLAKFQGEGDTHVSTRVVGTFGYVAPEYAVSGKLSDKSDVFSFGVMLLELISGRRPVFSGQGYMDESLVTWARPLLTQAGKDGNYDALIDPCLEKVYGPNEMTRMVACAAACVRQSAKLRPRMSEIVRFLEGELPLEVLHGEVLPGHSAIESSSNSEFMRRLRRMAFGNPEDTSSSLYSVSESNENQDSSFVDNDPYEIAWSRRSTKDFSSEV
ncbi:proline-rich receptor-like protein kinase PERK2 [Zingiber officinale]|uniref:proline-rich receptor-like protein kinase PERK2 n=1 Tax=Zingiber officinale TaxID=94328 RepID=UPI001C4D82CC|nr:proline-rich receptor-like protein kinase PERK2 [Zingiber officinale]